jgi:hypothetical protein
VTAARLGKAGYEVLNAVALKKMAGADVLADVTGLSPDQVSGELSALAEKELVVIIAGSALPSDGAGAALAGSAATRYAALRADPEVISQADRFDEVNRALLTTMTAWQQVTIGGQKVANDHQDSAYDDRVITRIGKLVQRLDPLLDVLSGHDERFAGYRRRFAAAVNGIDEGREELVSSPTADSVHTIWFEFHEDLLRTLGRERKE